MDWRALYERRLQEYEELRQASAQRMRQLWAQEAQQKSSRCVQVPSLALHMAQASGVSHAHASHSCRASCAGDRACSSAAAASRPPQQFRQQGWGRSHTPDVTAAPAEEARPGQGQRHCQEDALDHRSQALVRPSELSSPHVYSVLQNCQPHLPLLQHKVSMQS